MSVVPCCTKDYKTLDQNTCFLTHSYFIKSTPIAIQRYFVLTLCVSWLRNTFTINALRLLLQHEIFNFDNPISYPILRFLL